jgi:hypothetical protein
VCQCSRRTAYTEAGRKNRIRARRGGRTGGGGKKKKNKKSVLLIVVVGWRRAEGGWDCLGLLFDATTALLAVVVVVVVDVVVTSVKPMGGGRHPSIKTFFRQVGRRTRACPWPQCVHTLHIHTHIPRISLTMTTKKTWMNQKNGNDSCWPGRVCAYAPCPPPRGKRCHEVRWVRHEGKKERRKSQKKKSLRLNRANARTAAVCM